MWLNMVILRIMNSKKCTMRQKGVADPHMKHLKLDFALLAPIECLRFTFENSFRSLDNLYAICL